MKMKSLLLICSLVYSSKFCFSQNPDYYYFEPANSGVNNLYFNTLISYKFLFIITQSEWASSGVTGPVEITSIWLKSNTAYNLVINDLKFTLGHSTLTQPVQVFADNYDVGVPVEVLNETVYNYTTLAGPWNDPPNGWSEIPLSVPFIYNGIDNLVFQGEYSNINYPIPIYANNGGVPITQLSSVFGSSSADDVTARPMLGISGLASQVSFASSDSSVCEKLCIDFFDFSINNPTSWEWSFPGGTPSSSTDQNPVQICYNIPGTYDVTLIASSATTSDTLMLPGFISVYPTPAVPTISVNGNVLTSSPAPSYQWQYNFVDIAGATNQSHTATLSGAYTVIITDSTGCSASATLDFTITSSGEPFSASIFQIYPNPSNGTVMLLFSPTQSEASEILISIHNSLGQVVFSDVEKSGQVNTVLDLVDLNGGIYFIELKPLSPNAGDQFALRQKLVISK